MYRYNYHIFEIDLLFSDKRIIINDNSRLIESKEIVDYSYSGVKVLNDRTTNKIETDYKISFLNIVEYLYWSGTIGGTPPPYAPTYFGFDFRTGGQGNYVYGVDQYAWPVIDGDVFASTVPIPAATWLFVSGLLGLIGIARRKK